MSDIAIKLENISKHYRLYADPKDRLKEALNPFRKTYHKKHEALCNIDLTIRTGDVIGIVGRNGCGKSTLLKIITKVLQPNEGRVIVNGKITALLELGAGFNPEFTGIDNIKFYANILGLSHADIEQKLDAIINFAELGDYLTQPVKTYSSGMKARLGFAVAVHVDPDILILDEVLAVGDALFRRKCYAKMEEFFKSGKTIVYVSHDANSVNQLCNRAILLYDGMVALDGLPSDVTKQYEKLIFSEDDKSIDILAKELALDIVDSKERSSLSSSSESSNDTLITPEAGVTAYFVPGLKAKSTLNYPSNGAHIADFSITTLDGERVNVLIPGDVYYYVYEVKFDGKFDRVSFGMKVKDIKGFELSSGASFRTNQVVNIEDPDKVVSVRWTIKCNLLPGEYYTNAGVSYEHDGKRTFLARVADSLVFKVVSKKDYLPQGVVDLRQKVSVSQGREKLL